MSDYSGGGSNLGPEPTKATLRKGEYVLTPEVARLYGGDLNAYIKARYLTDPRDSENESE